MNTRILFVATILVASAPFAAALENEPDCESNQPWIGYGTTDSVRAAYNGLQRPGGVNVCEGEHWDGQDSVQDDEVATSDCATAAQQRVSSPDDAFVSLCGDQNINDGEADPTDGASPVAIRVSKFGDSVYVGGNIFAVGRAVVWTNGQDSAAVYLRDNTPGNVLATAISSARVTKGFVSENDCDQATYQAGAYAPAGESRCGRDNTAITVSVLS